MPMLEYNCTEDFKKARKYEDYLNEIFSDFLRFSHRTEKESSSSCKSEPYAYKKSKSYWNIKKNIQNLYTNAIAPKFQMIQLKPESVFTHLYSKFFFCFFLHIDNIKYFCLNAHSKKNFQVIWIDWELRAAALAVVIWFSTKIVNIFSFYRSALEQTFIFNLIFHHFMCVIWIKNVERKS